MTSPNNKKGIIVSVLAIALVLGGLIWFSRGSGRNNRQENLNSSGGGKLSAEESTFDFGTVSMSAGKVSHTFKIKNDGTELAIITKLYTSCMCTSAELMVGGKRLGPFGMPGHGFIPSINQTVNAGESAEILVTFDPAAHGPAGVGPTNRTVYIEQKSGAEMRLEISTIVTP